MRCIEPSILFICCCTILLGVIFLVSKSYMELFSLFALKFSSLVKILSWYGKVTSSKAFAEVFKFWRATFKGRKTSCESQVSLFFSLRPFFFDCIWSGALSTFDFSILMRLFLINFLLLKRFLKRWSKWASTGLYFVIGGDKEVDIGSLFRWSLLSIVLSYSEPKKLFIIR